MSNLIRTAVLDRRTKENISIDFGDFVVCCNCGRTMLVNIGTERCPICDEKALTWEDKENKEVSYEYFYNNNDYILVDTEC